MKLRTLGAVIAVWTVLNLIVMTPAASVMVLPTQGDSMKPTLRGCELTVVDTTPEYENVDEGDIVAFREDGQQVMHRVIEHRVSGIEHYWYTKGDNAKHHDRMVSEERLIGEVEHVVRPPTCS